MARENFTALLLLYIRPVAAMGRILDHGKLWFAIAVALLVAMAVHLADPTPMIDAGAKAAAQAQLARQDPGSVEPPPPGHFATEAVARFASYDAASFFSALFAMAIGMVPALIVTRALTGYGSFGVLMRRDYLSLLMCVLFCWSAVYAAVALVLGIAYAGAGTSIHGAVLFAVATVWFLALAALAVRTALGMSFGGAAGLTAVGAFVAILWTGLFAGIGSSMYFLASPLVLFYAWRMMGSEVASLGEGLRGRQHFQQQMEIATTNPRDADAHYQLGLVYQQRRQYSEAIARFQKAVEIDPSEADAQFQLGRIAREQGRFDDAIRYLTAAAALNDKISSSEVWRELGSAYVGASRFEEAAAALQKYTDRRSYDPEGQYWYGKALAGVRKFAEAKAAFETCVEAVDTMPKHRRAEVRKWKGLAKDELSKGRIE